jgi:hypothetical protein
MLWVTITMTLIEFLGEHLCKRLHGGLADNANGAISIFATGKAHGSHHYGNYKN